MSQKKASDNQHAGSIVVRDRSNRRRFMQQGAAFMAVAGIAAASGSRQALAADCDRGAAGEKKPEHAGNGSDSDTGASADPLGCGRRHEEKPKISQHSIDAHPSVETRVSVAKIKA
jgi:hypothetical protein